MDEEARRRQEDARYRCFFLKIADRLKSQGFDDPPTPTPAHWLEFPCHLPVGTLSGCMSPGLG